MFDLSIIVPTKNHGDALLKALLGIERTTHASFEIVAVIDGEHSRAGEGIVNLASSVFGNRLRVIREEASVGFGAACNEAISIATGRHVCVLRDDVHPLDGALDAAIAQLDSLNDESAILALLAEPGVGAELATTLDLDGIHYATSHIRGTLVADFPFARRQTFATLLFDPTFTSAAATAEFSLRAWHEGHVIVPATSAALISHETRLRDEQQRLAETRTLINASALPSSPVRFDANSPCTLGRSTMRRAA